MAGVIGNAIHRNPWAQYNMMTGEYTYILPNLQRQNQLEGYVAGFLLVFSSFCFIAIAEWLPLLRSAASRRIFFLLLVFLMISSLNTWMAMYCYKNKFYPFEYYFDWFLVLQWGRATVQDLTGIVLY